MLLSSVSSRALLGRAMTDLGNGVGASTSLGSTSHPSGVEPNSLGPVHRSVSERGEGCLHKGGRGSSENEASPFPEGLEEGKEEEDVDKACVSTPRAECHLEGVGQPRSASGRPARGRVGISFIPSVE